MRIAVASQNFRTVTPHAGRCRRFLIFDVRPGEPPVEVGRFDLPKDLAMAEFSGEGGHPLDAVDVIVAGSMGEGFARRMARRGISAVQTGETDPVEAARQAAGTGDTAPQTAAERPAPDAGAGCHGGGPGEPGEHRCSGGGRHRHHHHPRGA